MINSRKKKIKENLLFTFGNSKDDSFEFEQIETYFRKKDNSAAFQILSDKTCNDLDFRELFAFIDRTNSKVGQQYLYNKLRVIPSNTNEIASHEELIGEFTNNPDLRVNIQSQLCKLNDTEAFYITSLFQDEHLKPPKWFFVAPILAFTSLSSLLLFFVIPKFFLVSIGVESL